MIKPKNTDIGRCVKYQLPSPDTTINNVVDTTGYADFVPPSEFGVIKSFNTTFIFVCFEKHGDNWSQAMACYPKHLEFVEEDYLNMVPRDLGTKAKEDLIKLQKGEGK